LFDESRDDVVSELGVDGEPAFGGAFGKFDAPREFSWWREGALKPEDTVWGEDPGQTSGVGEVGFECLALERAFEGFGVDDEAFFPFEETRAKPAVGVSPEWWLGHGGSSVVA